MLDVPHDPLLARAPDAWLVRARCDDSGCRGDAAFWLGHQGYEYFDLGRVWQIVLYGGLIGWLFQMLRAIAPALRRGAIQRSLIAHFRASVVAIGLAQVVASVEHGM